MSKQDVIDRLNKTLGRMMGAPVLLDPDGRLSERGEYELNLQLQPHGLRVARNDDGSRQDLSCSEPSLRIEADGVECEHCAHGSHAHEHHRNYGGECGVDGCECKWFVPREP